MTVSATLALRQAELSRRVRALPDEIKAWKQRTQNELDMNAHHSQVQAIGTLLAELGKRQETLLADLKRADDAGVFSDQCIELIREVIKSQRVWDFFRDKLELRFSPAFQEPLWVADTVAWDCYRPVLEQAADRQILLGSQLREPPLTYLTAEFSPATWVRGSRPNDGRNYELGTATLPIPVVELPWDHVQNVWEFLSLHHEVGHDLEADLKLRDPLAANLRTALDKAGVPPQRAAVWQAWQGELFADLVGLQLAGPAFTENLMHLLLLPAHMVVHYDAADPHPTHYVRILMNAAYLQTLVPGRDELQQHAARIESLWKDLYGPQPQFDQYVGDFPHVFAALMDSITPALNGATVRELMPFSAGDDARIRRAAAYLATGQNAPANIRPRHCVSAARLAATAVANAAGDLADSLPAIHNRTVQLVRQNAAPGLRGGDASAPHQKFIAGFADSITF